jgi:PAS domain S-box-containing protein
MATDWKEKIIEAAIAIVLGWIGVGAGKAYKAKKGKLKTIIRNIGDLNETADISAASEALLLAFLDSYEVAAYLTNDKGEVTYVNAAYLDLTGFEDSRDAHDFGYLDSVPDEDRERILKEHDFTKQHPSRSAGKIRVRQIGTGKLIECRCKITPIYKKDGETLLKSIGFIRPFKINA